MDNLDIEHCGSLPPEQSVTGNFLKSHYRLDANAYNELREFQNHFLEKVIKVIKLFE